MRVRKAPDVAEGLAIQLEPTWTVPVDLEVLRESDDPLGFRAAADRIATLTCSPISSRTTSIRHLSMFCWAAKVGTRKTESGIDRVAFDRASRIITISATGMLTGSAHDLNPAQKRSLTLPGRRRATHVAKRVSENRTRIDDFDQPLLGAEHAQGLWGGYASLATILNLLDTSRTLPRLTPEGDRWARRFQSWCVPNSRSGWFIGDLLSDNETACRKLAQAFDPDLWPVTDAECIDFLTLLDEGGLRARPRLTYLMSKALQRSSLTSISHDRDAKELFSVDGMSLAEVATLGALASRLIRDVEFSYRLRLSEGISLPEPDLRPYKPLFEWANRQGLDMGVLRPEKSRWIKLDRHHEALFHRRGRPSWPELAKANLLELPSNPRLPDFRFGALRRLGDECRDSGRLP